MGTHSPRGTADHRVSGLVRRWWVGSKQHVAGHKRECVLFVVGTMVQISVMGIAGCMMVMGILGNPKGEDNVQFLQRAHVAVIDSGSNSCQNGTWRELGSSPDILKAGETKVFKQQLGNDANIGVHGACKLCGNPFRE